MTMDEGQEKIEQTTCFILCHFAAVARKHRARLKGSFGSSHGTRLACAAYCQPHILQEYGSASVGRARVEK